MKTKTKRVPWRLGLVAMLLAPAGFIVTGHLSYANSASWQSNPTDIEWTNPTNWSPNTVPNGPDDIATFNTSDIVDPFIIDQIELNSLIYTEGADEFSIVVAGGEKLTLSGQGIRNNSGILQRINLEFVTGDPLGGAGLIFTNQATAGVSMFFDVFAAQLRGQSGYINFLDSSSAGSGTFVTADSTDRGSDGGLIMFGDTSTAAHGSFTNKGSTNALGKSAVTQFVQNATGGHGVFVNEPTTRPGGGSGLTQFFDQSTAGQGTFTSNGSAATGAAGGMTQFFDNSTAGNATLIANGGGEPGVIDFEDASDGGTAKVRLVDGGTLDVSSHTGSGLSIGSLEGNGLVFLGPQDLSIGSNNLSTLFSGIIQDSGSLTKVGIGTLTLSNVNTYSGGTIIERGTLLVQTGQDSATGSGPVQVNAGTFGGRSNISGAVTIGRGSGTGAFLAPGIKGAGVLVIRNSLTLKADATYNCELNIRTSKADQVIAKGVTIESGAQFAFSARGNQTLPVGTVFTVIDNRSPQPISGTFANLLDHSVFTANGNSFRADYEGGGGNDLTLTVVP